MSGYFDRGASAGGHDHGYFDRKDITGPEGVGTGVTGGPGAVANDNLDEDQYSVVAEGEPSEQAGNNPNIARAIPDQDVRLDETAGVDSPIRADESYDQIIEGSDSEQTGTSSSQSSVRGKDNPNRNTATGTSRDQLDNVGSWSTIDNQDSAGSPTGNS